jgi:hypothetical protein
MNGYCVFAFGHCLPDAGGEMVRNWTLDIGRWTLTQLLKSNYF